MKIILFLFFFVGYSQSDWVVHNVSTVITNTTWIKPPYPNNLPYPNNPPYPINPYPAHPPVNYPPRYNASWRNPGYPNTGYYPPNNGVRPRYINARNNASHNLIIGSVGPMDVLLFKNVSFS